MWLKNKWNYGCHIDILIFGLGRVGSFLLEYLLDLSEKRIHIIVVGRDLNKISRDVNIIKAGAYLRGLLQSKVTIDTCDFTNVSLISDVIGKHKPDIIINVSRLVVENFTWGYAEQGLWVPLKTNFSKQIMCGVQTVGYDPTVIDVQFPDVTNAWLKSANVKYPEFGAGNFNHLIPKMMLGLIRFYPLLDPALFDITLSTSHYHSSALTHNHDMKNIEPLLNISYLGNDFVYDRTELLKACSIQMRPSDKMRTLAASSIHEIIRKLLLCFTTGCKVKLHVPGFDGEMGGYPITITSCDGLKINWVEDYFSLQEMRQHNSASVKCEGVEKIENGVLHFTDELLTLAYSRFKTRFPDKIVFSEIDQYCDYIIDISRRVPTA